MAERPFTQADLDILKQWDTPTICNGLEITNPERRAIGFTTSPFVVLDPSAPPIVGLARTGTIRAKEPPRSKTADRVAWYNYAAATDFPTIVVLQDLDDQKGYGAFWGDRIWGATVRAPGDCMGGRGHGRRRTARVQPRRRALRARRERLRGGRR